MQDNELSSEEDNSEYESSSGEEGESSSEKSDRPRKNY
jgi:hypothetical protein